MKIFSEQEIDTHDVLKNSRDVLYGPPHGPADVSVEEERDDAGPAKRLKEGV